jgi:hypothetical protein
MRVPKKILIWSADPADALDLAYVMRLGHRFRGSAFSTIEEVKGSIGPGRALDEYALAIIFSNGSEDGQEIAQFIKVGKPLCPVLAVAVCDGVVLESESFDMTLKCGANCAMILDCALTMSAGKRGPRKGFSRVSAADSTTELSRKTG